LEEDARASGQARLAVEGLSHAYGKTTVLDDVSFEVSAGEMVALLGPSGCGKTTVLRAVAGLVRPTRGSIRLGDHDLSHRPPRARGVGMVFQSYALFPHMTVAENIAYPLAARKAERSRRSCRVAELLSMVRLGGLANRLPHQLSGGEQQRVAIARALASEPALLLLDEPFSALDRSVRLELQAELMSLQQSLGVTTILVTHDQTEAQHLAKRIVLMNRGRVEQIGTPLEIYDRPKTLFANTFIGLANRLRGVVVKRGAQDILVEITTGDQLVLKTEQSFGPGDRVVVTIRPEDVKLIYPPGLEHRPFRARVVNSMTIGPNQTYEAELADGTRINSTQPRSRIGGPTPLQAVQLSLDIARCQIFYDNAV
jgi:putative spermidine/putrescine transport system ATP-binding protein